MAFKGVVTGALLCALAIGAPACAESGVPYKPIPHYNVRACVNLGNAFEAPEEGSWGLAIEDRHLDIIKQAGFDTIRVPVRWSAHAMEEGPYLLDYGFLDRVSGVVDGALERGLNVILNMHHYHELSKDMPGHRERFLSLWAQLSEHFRDHSLDLHFELLNEPIGELKGWPLHKLLTDAIEVVRKTNPERVLIVGGAPWNSLEGLEELAPFEADNIVRTFHYYVPHEFTHQGAEFLDEVPEAGRHWGTQKDYDKLYQDVWRAAADMRKWRRPVLLGEFGVYRSVPENLRRAYYKSVREAFESKGIGWCAWDFATNFGLWDNEKGEWRHGYLEDLGLSTPSAD